MKVIAKGIDVSKWQGTINWTQVKGAGISFVMMRLGRGKLKGGPCDYDIRFKDNIAGALAAGSACTSTATPSALPTRRPRRNGS